MSSKVSEQLSYKDKRLIQGFRKVRRPEPSQLELPYWSPETEKEKKETSQKRLEKIKDKANKVIEKVKEAEEKVDSRCSHLKVDGSGSRLFQAMVRVFDEETTTVTYEHYKRALEMRKELAEEDTIYLRRR